MFFPSFFCLIFRRFSSISGFTCRCCVQWWVRIWVETKMHLFHFHENAKVREIQSIRENRPLFSGQNSTFSIEELRPLNWQLLHMESSSCLWVPLNIYDNIFFESSLLSPIHFETPLPQGNSAANCISIRDTNDVGTHRAKLQGTPRWKSQR